MRKPIAFSHSASELPDSGVLLCAVGYESRSRFIAEQIGDTAAFKLALQFDQRTVLSFDENLSVLEKLGFEFFAADEEGVAGCIQRAVELIRSGDASSLIVDISSMTRPMIADLVSYFSNFAPSGLDVHFCYTPAVFKAPQNRVPPQTFSGPVTPAYAGWSSDPSRPIAAIIGTGYEYGRALGILEYLEPTVAWLFNPTGVNELYDAALLETNRHLYDLIPRQQVVDYEISEPLACFERVESLVYGLKGQCRVLLCPFGPKLFALICMLVAQVHRPDVTVWRVSGGQSEQPFDHASAGMIYRLSIRFEKVD